MSGDAAPQFCGCDNPECNREPLTAEEIARSGEFASPTQRASSSEGPPAGDSLRDAVTRILNGLRLRDDGGRYDRDLRMLAEHALTDERTDR